MHKTGLIAAAALLALATPAAADIHFDAGGYVRSYFVYADNDETSSALPQDSLHSLEFRHDIELHLKGQRTLDSGVTVGARAELKLAGESDDGSVNTPTSLDKDPDQLDEAYIFFTGDFGEFSLGSRDGAAFLLQVAAPSADENVDGLRVWIQGWNPDVWDDGVENASLAPSGAIVRLDYDNADFGKSDRLVYLTPKWNGFQAGASYAPENGQLAVDGAAAGMSPDDRPGSYENIVDVALRYDGEIGPVKLRASAIHGGGQTELDAAGGTFGSDDVSTWDLGLHLTWEEFSLGAALMRSNTGTSGPRTDARIWVAGAAWDHDRWHAGASIYHLDLHANAFGLGLADDLRLRRITAGGGYAFAPGMQARGTVSFLDADNGINSAIDPQQLQVTFGTEFWF